MLKTFTLLLFSLYSTGCGYLSHAYNYKFLNRPRYVSLNSVDDIDLDGETVKVVSYNIKHGKKTKKAIKLFLKEKNLKDADIILLQEMTPEEVKRIAKALDYNYVFYPAILHPVLKKDFGNAILSKWPILNDQKIILPALKTKTRQRIAVYATVQIEDKKVAVLSLHMGIFVKPSDRKRLVEIMLDPIPPSTEYCIIGGDFNSFTKKDRKNIITSFTKSDFEYATEDIGWTYNQWYFLNRKSTLDHIFTKGMEPVDAGKVVTKEASDHLPIWTELKFL